MNRSDFLKIEEETSENIRRNEEERRKTIEHYRLKAIEDIPQKIAHCINEINKELKKVAESCEKIYYKENVNIFIEYLHSAQKDTVISAINEYLKTSGFKEYNVLYKKRTININYDDCNDTSYEIEGLSIYINPWRA